MKNFLYIVVSAIFILSVQSCKRIADSDDNNLLNNMGGNETGINGARFLYREYSSNAVLAQYTYNMTKLSTVTTNNDTEVSTTNVYYNGDLINKITSTGVLAATDKFTTERYFNYNSDGSKITTITETSTLIPNYATANPIVEYKFKKLYTVAYDSSNRIKTITMQEGLVQPLVSFTYSSYSITTLTYDSTTSNVAECNIDSGTITSGVFNTADDTMTYTYDAYDLGVSPFTLLPTAYNLYRAINDGIRYYAFSYENPKRISVTGTSIVTPIQYYSDLTYDPQNYMVSGHDINYDYRPF